MTVVCDPQDQGTGYLHRWRPTPRVRQTADLQAVKVREVMTPTPKTIRADKLAVEAVALMEKHRINQLIVTNAQGALAGALNMHDLFKAKVV